LRCFLSFKMRSIIGTLKVRQREKGDMTADTFRKMALGFPQAAESSHMGHADFRRAGKIFATLGYPDDDWHGEADAGPAALIRQKCAQRLPSMQWRMGAGRRHKGPSRVGEQAVAATCT
jgi:hypothetical protein